MTQEPPGTVLHYRVTWLEMAARPRWGWPAAPANLPVQLLRAEAPPVWYLLALYDAVGRDYAWEDLHAEPEDKLHSWLDDPAVSLWTMMHKGWPHGFFVLDARGGESCDIAYFGLVPEAMGRGLGTFLMRTAILTGWDIAGVQKLTVNTCSLDHPRALASYQKAGFTVTRQEARTRTLRRARDPSRIPD